MPQESYAGFRLSDLTKMRNFFAHSLKLSSTDLLRRLNYQAEIYGYLFKPENSGWMGSQEPEFRIQGSPDS